MPVDEILNEPDRARAKRLVKRANELRSQWAQWDTACPMFAIVTPDDQQVIATFLGVETPERKGSFARFLDEGWMAWQRLDAARR